MSEKDCMKGSNYWVAFVLIGLGTLFLLDNLDILDFIDFWQLWPLILIGIGVSKIRTHRESDKNSGIVLLVIGSVFLLSNLDILPWNMVWSFWPIALIAAGLWMIYRHKNRPQAEGGSNADQVDAFALFGGNERKILSQNFQGGGASAVFGGVGLNLMEARLAPGENELAVFAMFGGIEISAPGHWNIIVKGFPIFGGLEESRSRIPDLPVDTERTLVVKGFVMFGGVEIKSK
jgi:predicted membrane protein